MSRRPFALSSAPIPKSTRKTRLAKSQANKWPISRLHSGTDYSESVVLLQDFWGCESIHRAIGIASSQDPSMEDAFQGIWFEKSGGGAGHWYPQFRESSGDVIHKTDGVDLDWQQGGSHGFCQMFAIMQYLANDYQVNAQDKRVALDCVAQMDSSFHQVSGMPIWAKNAQQLLPLMKHLITKYKIVTSDWDERRRGWKETMVRVHAAIEHLEKATSEYELEQFSFDITT